jgi:hypothetical protein
MYEAYGADTLRVYEMSMGPLEQSKPWETRAVSGAHRLLQRVWRIVVDEDSGVSRLTDADPTREDLVVLHKTIEAVRAAMDDLRVNTPIARITELTNHLTSTYPNGAPRSLGEPLVLLVAPFAPHMAEELWARTGHDTSLTRAPFPVTDPAYLVTETVEVPVQINGKLRATIVVPSGADAAALEQAARADEKIGAQIEGKTVRKVVAVPGRLVQHFERHSDRYTKARSDAVRPVTWAHEFSTTVCFAFVFGAEALGNSPGIQISCCASGCYSADCVMCKRGRAHPSWHRRHPNRGHYDGSRNDCTTGGCDRSGCDRSGCDRSGWGFD